METLKGTETDPGLDPVNHDGAKSSRLTKSLYRPQKARSCTALDFAKTGPTRADVERALQAGQEAYWVPERLRTPTGDPMQRPWNKGSHLNFVAPKPLIVGGKHRAGGNRDRATTEFMFKQVRRI
eukprot:TRINITY_DN12785_c1_g1_i2.p2 TRINITY_DN12785_c1_g1~~TRINITY_DN12785_c1_g1_i2.p2  ORF type:complete len:125 (-),score=20.31 TRINITY_DN12785_c1_g1_i2:184-558(-)